jgi:hypothetical protein
MRNLALLGAALAAASWVYPLQPASGMILLERLLLLGVLFVAPLGYTFVLEGRPKWLAWGLGPTALLVLVANVLPPGDLSAALTLPYALYTGVVAVVITRDRLKDLKDLPGLLIDIGALELVVGAAWLVLSRRGGTQLGYDAATVILTAIHFHFAGFAAAIIAGLVGKLELGRARRAWTPAAVVLATGPMWVALGVVIHPALQVVGALLLAASVVVIGALLAFPGAKHARSTGKRAVEVIFVFAGVLLVGTMGMAAAFAITEFQGQPFVSVPVMAMAHGVGNAVGFGVGALLAFTLAPVSGSPQPKEDP